MTAFISYSIEEQEQFLVSFLSIKLGERDFYLSSRFDGSETTTLWRIRSASLFIGIITEKGQDNTGVLNEYKYATSHNVPSLLLIEEGVRIPQNHSDENVVVFDRNNPECAIEYINHKIDNLNVIAREKANSNSAAAWLFGGLALISLVKRLATTKSYQTS